jgi:hypothetical protein
MRRAGRAWEWVGQVLDLYRYVWRTTGRSQILLSILAAGVFLLELAPLELQRRIVNSAVEQEAYQLIALLCGLYLIVVLAQGSLKLTLNVYRGSVIETVSKRFRLDQKRRRGLPYRSSPPRWTQSPALPAPASPSRY